MRFCSIDGDQIGASLEKLIINQDSICLSHFSKLVNEAINSISQNIVDSGCNIIFSGGDNILFCGDFNLSFCNEVSEYFERKTSNKLSVGIGDTMLDSFLALKIAKASGGAVIIDYCEVMRNG